VFVELVNLQAIETIGNNGATIGDASGRSQIVKMNLPTLLALGRCAARRSTLIIGRGILKSHGELVLTDLLCRNNAPGALILVHFPRALDALRRQIKNFDHFLTLLTRTSAGDEFIVESIEADNIILAARFFLCSTCINLALILCNLAVSINLIKTRQIADSGIAIDAELGRVLVAPR